MHEHMFINTSYNNINAPSREEQVEQTIQLYA